MALGIFSRVFGGGPRTTGPDSSTRVKDLSALSKEILVRAHKCSEALKQYLKYDDPNEKQAAGIAVQNEFLYLFIFLATREVLNRQSSEKARALVEFLEHTIIGSMLDGMFSDWPDDRRQRLRADFLLDLNDAESEYFKCTELFSREQPFTGDSVLTTFARKVTLVLGHENLNPEVFMQVLERTTEAYTSMDLDGLALKAARAL